MKSTFFPQKKKKGPCFISKPKAEYSIQLLLEKLKSNKNILIFSQNIFGLFSGIWLSDKSWKISRESEGEGLLGFWVIFFIYAIKEIIWMNQIILGNKNFKEK